MWRREREKSYLREERIETVYLLSLLYVCVILGYTSKGELIHEVDLIRRFHVLVLPEIQLVQTRQFWRVHTLKSLTIIGNVALNSITCLSFGI